MKTVTTVTVRPHAMLVYVDGTIVAVIPREMYLKMVASMTAELVKPFEPNTPADTPALFKPVDTGGPHAFAEARQLARRAISDNYAKHNPATKEKDNAT